MDWINKTLKTLDHYRNTTLAVAITGAVVLWGFGCESTSTINTVDGKTITVNADELYAYAQLQTQNFSKRQESINSLQAQLNLDITQTDETVLEDRKSTRLNSSHSQQSRMPSSA